jgi:hypothetical protein
LQWKPSDAISADWTHTNQPSTASTVLQTITSGTNITDKRYITTGQPQFAGGVVYGTYNAPREWYATFGVKL